MSIPSALKWMAERRARLAHEFEQTRQFAEELASRATALKHDLDSLDRTIQLYDSRIDPKTIGPVAAHKGRYGKHGGLRHCVIERLHAEAPEPISTSNLAAYVILELQLDLVTPLQRHNWVHNSFTRGLKRLVNEGLVERVHDPLENKGSPGSWRWKQEETRTLAELVAGEQG